MNDKKHKQKKRTAAEAGKPRITEKQGVSIYLSRLERETSLRVSGPEPFAAMDYADELRAKDRAFSTYWDSLTRRCAAGGLIPSPLPRKYRTTTKRRVHVRGRGVILSSDESTLSDRPSLLEPDSHSAIYESIAGMFSVPAGITLAKALNFLIIRGDYESQGLIFNVRKTGADIVRQCTAIAESLREKHANLSSAFIFHDPEGSRYYLNSSPETDDVRLKRIFGSRTLSISVLDVTYRFYPDSFSQINLSICPEMLRTAGSLLAQGKNSRLVDLYCGYGFFSCYLAGSFSEIIGVDFAGQSIDSARENMKALRTGAKWSFHSRRVDRRTAESLLPEPGGRECFILDPPRNGTAPGVLETVAARGPELALHVFCGVETIPAELERWRRSGYEPVRCEPLDMFPGTPDVEVMVLLKRVQSVKTSSRSKSGR